MIIANSNPEITFLIQISHNNRLNVRFLKDKIEKTYDTLKFYVSVDDFIEVT